MLKKSKILLLISTIFLGFCLISCSGSSPSPSYYMDKYDFFKTTEQEEAMVGEGLRIKLVVVNKSSYNIESLKIQKETDEGDFVVVGEKYIESGMLKSGEKRQYFYTVIPALAGKNKVKPSRITQVRVKGIDRILSVPGNVGFSNSLEIDVKPINLSISQIFPKRKLRLGSKLPFYVLIRNQSKVKINSVEILLRENNVFLKLVKHIDKKKDFLILPDQQKKIRFIYKAMKAGTIHPERAVLKRLKVIGDVWITCDQGYGTSKQGPMIRITPVLLPGMDLPLTYLTEELDTYFNMSFIFKILLIEVLIICIFLLYNFAIRSVLVGSFFGRIVLIFLLVAVLTIFLLFTWSGLKWFWRTIFPPFWIVCLILLCSCILISVFKLIPMRNIILGALIFGFSLSFISYVSYVGLRAFKYNDFMNFPLHQTILVDIALGIILNIWFIRKEIWRKQ